MAAASNGVKAYLGLGSNLGPREENLRAAVEILAGSRQGPPAAGGPPVEVLRASSVYATAPWGLEDQPEFLNSALEVRTALAPADLLDLVKSLEVDLGRRPGPRNGPRIIDVDILLYGDAVVQEEDLQIPHPRLHLRAFALVPLAELDPGLVHPTLETTVGDLAARVEGLQGVRRWGPPLPAR